uniref:Ligand dependent nuclear receptor interacting factor 1 n=1 Tax=Amphilophus citrinellus TaxID=61819 RepID=A0A3Q0RB26_AMPCI
PRRKQFTVMCELLCHTGVFYQAMPAIGADGKNIMKLIPVQMVNRQFFQTQTRKPEMDPSSEKAVTINIASAPVNMATKTVLSSSVSQQITRKQVSVVNVNLGHSNSLDKHSSQQKTLNLMAEVPPVATFTKKSGMPVKHINQLPVTVKSPALPRGQYLQIPPNAQVQTVPASKLPPGIQKQIFTSSASSSSLGSVLPNVVFVSPVTTVNQSVTSPSDAAPRPLQVFPNPSSVTSCGLQPKEAKQQLKLIPKVSQRPNSPTRWVIEEVDASAGPNIKPLNCPSVTSEILRAVAQRENSCKQFKTFRRTVSQLSQDSAVQGQQNALVMCNGKVFFVAKKCTLPSKTTAATKGSEFSKTIVPHFSSFQQFLQSAATHTRKRTVCPCCIPTTLDPAVKSRAGEELEKWALTAEQMSKKGGRAKVPRKDGRMSCEEAKNKPDFNTHGAPTSDNVSTSSVDSDELKRQEQIKRLKDVLKEKEAALELMRNRVS